MVEAIEESPSLTLRAFLEATNHATETNCWWALYGVAPIVRSLSVIELEKRKARRTERAQNAGSQTQPPTTNQL